MILLDLVLIVAGLLATSFMAYAWSMETKLFIIRVVIYVSYWLVIISASIQDAISNGSLLIGTLTLLKLNLLALLVLVINYSIPKHVRKHF